MDIIFFDSWESILRTTVITVLAYSALIILLRISGKRTLSSMNAFDFIVTIALGSSLATVALNKDVALTDGVLVFLLFIGLQYGITWWSVRNKSIKRKITNHPTLLIYDGKKIDSAIKKERITDEELFLAARKKGVLDLKEIDFAVLETTGSLTIIPSKKTKSEKGIQDIENYDEVTKNHKHEE